MFLWWAWYPGTSINLPSLPQLLLLLLLRGSSAFIGPAPCWLIYYNYAPPASANYSGGLLQLLIAASAAAAATAEGEQRLNWPGFQQVDEGEQRLDWPGSLQVVELLFTSPGGAVFLPRRSCFNDAPKPPEEPLAPNRRLRPSAVCRLHLEDPVSVSCVYVAAPPPSAAKSTATRRHLGYTHTHRCIRLFLLAV